MRTGMDRLYNRLLTFRDEHLALKILPMMRNIADTIWLDDPDIEGHESRVSFDIARGQQVITNELTYCKPINISSFLIQGTVVTLYNRDSAYRIQKGPKFKSEMEQMEFLEDQKEKFQDQYFRAKTRAREFVAIGEINLRELVRSFTGN